MKRKEKQLTMDEAVEKFAALTDKVMAKFSPEERARRFRNAARIVAAAKKKERARLSKSPRSSSRRRRIQARG
jgi:hypothetical protein